jgi:hypothetical protein
MWVFSKTGFVSIVKHADFSDKVLVRARCREDLENFLQTPSPMRCESVITISNTQEADYPWRCVVSHAHAQCIVGAMVMAIDYENFKDAACAYPEAADDKMRDEIDLRHNAYMDVWSSMQRFQNELENPPNHDTYPW